MYKQSNRGRRKNRAILIVTFCILLLSLGIAYSILKQDLKIIGKANIETKPIEPSGYEVTYTIDNKWITNHKYYYSITMTLKNNTNELLEGWKISIKAPSNVELLNFSNVNCKLNGNIIEFTNVAYNWQVPSKESVSFEFQLATTDPYYQPSDIIVNDNNQQPSPEEPDKPEETEKKASFEYIKENEWTSGNDYFYQYLVKIKNIGFNEIHSWKFEMHFKTLTKVNQIWNANYEIKEENQFIFTNTAYNGMIEPKKEISFGLILESQDNQLQLQEVNVELY